MSRLELRPVTLRLRRPLRTAHGPIATREVWVVSLRDGVLVGQGEAAPLPAFGTETAEACVAALRRFELAAPPDTLDGVATALRGLEATPAARCAIECALLDLVAQRRGVAVAEVLTDGPASPAGASEERPSADQQRALRAHGADEGADQARRCAPPDDERLPSARAGADEPPDGAPQRASAARAGADEALDGAPRAASPARAGAGDELDGSVRAPRATLEVSALIDGEDAAALAQAATEAVAAGFTTLKVKVAARPLSADAGRLYAVRRAVGEGVRLRIDANGGWSEGTARSALRGLEALRLELCEQPVPAADVESLRLLRRQVPCRLAADEALLGPAARVRRILERDPEVAADALVLKPMALGGLLPALALARAAEAAGLGCYVTTLLDGPLARAAAAHLAAALPGDSASAPGLGTVELFEGVGPDAFTPRRGTITMPAGPGWGLSVPHDAGVSGAALRSPGAGAWSPEPSDGAALRRPDAGARLPESSDPVGGAALRGAGTWPPQPSDPVRGAALRSPGAVALTWSSSAWNWAQLDACVDAWADWLQELGVAAGDRVATLAWNCPELLVAFHALGRLGAALVPLNPRLAPVELERLRLRAGAKLTLLERAAAAPWPASRPLGDGPALLEPLAGGAAVLAAGPAFTRSGAEGTSRDRAAAAAPASTGETGRCCGSREPGAGSPPWLHHASPLSIAAALFTSGTTGEPRLIELSHARFLASAAASGENLGSDAAQRWLGTLPLFHVGGLAMAHRCAVYGARLDLEDGFDAARVCARLDDGVTHLSLVPTTLERLLDERADRPFPTTVRAALVGGGPASATLLARARRLGLPVLQTYGLTEACSQVATERPGDADGTTAGPPLAGVELRIAGADAAGVGEILVRGAAVVAPEGAWLATGDLGSVDAWGRLTVYARRTDLIITGGENVMPLEVERALAQHPAIREVAVTGRADARWGQVPVALVVLREPVEAAAVLTWARTRLASFKVPREIRAVATLPRNPMGKLDRALLRRLAE